MAPVCLCTYLPAMRRVSLVFRLQLPKVIRFTLPSTATEAFWRYSTPVQDTAVFKDTWAGADNEGNHMIRPESRNFDSFQDALCSLSLLHVVGPLVSLACGSDQKHDRGDCVSHSIGELLGLTSVSAQLGPTWFRTSYTGRLFYRLCTVQVYKVSDQYPGWIN